MVQLNTDVLPSYRYRDWLSEEEQEFFDALDAWLGQNRKWDKPQHPHWQQHYDAFNLIQDLAAHKAFTERGTWGTGQKYEDAYKYAAETNLEPLIQLLMADLEAEEEPNDTKQSIIDVITRKY
jgi:hypothetical protein